MVPVFTNPYPALELMSCERTSLQKLSEEETATIDKICKEEANAYILFDPDIIKGLYRRGLVYFDAPVYPDDRFKGNFAFYSPFGLQCLSIHHMLRELIP